MDISYGFIAAIVAAGLLLLFLLKTFNRLVALRNGVRNAWSDIDVQLARRHELLPNLVETVRGYTTHERETLQAVTQARSQAMTIPSADIVTRAAAEMALTGAVGKLLARAENYPEVKAMQNFLLLQEQLTSTENRIAFARQHYNELVRQYNSSLAVFPRNLVAGAFGFSPASLLAAQAADQMNVPVTI